MTVLIKHSKVSTIPDTDDTSLVRPSDWNADHVVVGAAESGANTDITSLSGITGGISSPDYIQFDTTYATPLTEGQLGWDGNDTLAVGMAGGNVIQHIGEDSFIYIKADSAITKGQVIMFTGAVGASGVLTGAPATGVTNPQYIMGIAAESIAHNSFGLVQNFGELSGLNTNAFNEGDVLYYDSAVVGGLTNVFPTSGPIVLIAAVAKKAGGNGTLVIRVSVTQRITGGSGATITQTNTGTTVAVTNPYNPASVAITGGTINGTTIGATTPAAGTFTTITGQTEVLRGTGQNLLLQSGWAGGTSGTVGSGAVAPTSWSFVSTSGTITYAAATSGSGNSIRFVATSERPAIQQAVVLTAGIVYSISFNIETVTSGTTTLQNLATTINTTATYTYFVNGVSVAGSTVATSNSRVQIVATITATSGTTSTRIGLGISGSSTGDITISNPQIEIGSTLNTYIPTTTTAVYGTPTLSFSGVSTIGLEQTGALYLQPAGTGAIQAQATTSTSAGGNARGANAVDWQTSRNGATQVASGAYSNIAGGLNNVNAAPAGALIGGQANTINSGATYSTLAGGLSNTVSGYGSALVGGNGNSALGYFNYIGGGYTNSGTANAAVTTQSGTMNGTTAVTLSGSNANIKVGQLITGTSIQSFPNTYVAAISGTSLTLSQAASGSSTSTLSFFTPHGVVVGGGNNQATGSYSFIGGGGDAGTAANRNVASGDWSFVGGGVRNTASGIGAVVVGGGTFASGVSANTATQTGAFTGGGWGNTSTAIAATIGGGNNNIANGTNSAIIGGILGTTRSIDGYHVFPANNNPLSSTQGGCQTAILTLARQTTDATATVLTSNSSAAGTTNQVILPNNSAYLFKATVISGVTGGGNTSGWKLEGVIKRGANAASTTLVGSVTTTLLAQDAGASGWTIAATADTTNGGLRFTFTGQAGTTIRTVCKVETTEMTF